MLPRWVSNLLSLHWHSVSVSVIPIHWFAVPLIEGRCQATLLQDSDKRKIDREISFRQNERIVMMSCLFTATAEVLQSLSGASLWHAMHAKLSSSLIKTMFVYSMVCTGALNSARLSVIRKKGNFASILFVCLFVLNVIWNCTQFNEKAVISKSCPLFRYVIRLRLATRLNALN